jgi:sphingolipid C9-methyltransferase
MPYPPVHLTKTLTIKNAPLVGLAEGNGQFSNFQLVAIILGVPWLLKRILPIVNHGGFKTYLFLVAILGVPLTVTYWTLMSMYGKRKNEKVALPSINIEEFITTEDPELKAKYHDKEKIPMQVFHDAYFEGKFDFNGELPVGCSTSYAQCRRVSACYLGDVLEIMEQRHIWAHFHFTPQLFKYVFFQMLPEVIMHSKSQDEDQVRDHYDRTLSCST